MQYILTGVTYDTGFRVFAFEGIGKDRARIEYEVRADLTLIRKYGIPMQELPLLCRRLLEQRDETEETRKLIYTEAEMCSRADIYATQAAAQKRKAPRRPLNPNAGAAWRGPRA